MFVLKKISNPVSNLPLVTESCMTKIIVFAQQRQNSFLFESIAIFSKDRLKHANNSTKKKP
jgi:hypothetical protein